jgi:acetyl esterase/lipase
MEDDNVDPKRSILSPQHFPGKGVAMSTNQPSLPAPIREAISALGAIFDRDVLEATRALFEGRWNMSQAEMRGDLAYGPDERHRIDLFLAGVSNAPLLIFVPGGGFVGGDKALYRHVGPVFARLGFTTAAVNYRLAPTHPWPAAAIDVASAIDWVASRAAQFGADGDQIYVLAQSAGAAHAAGALFDRRFRPTHLGAVRSAVLMSGFYRMSASEEASNLRAYFGDDTSQYDDRSPAFAAVGSSVPVALTVAEFDPAFLASQTLTLAAEFIKRDGKFPPLLWHEGHNHVSPLLSAGTGPGDPSASLAATLLRLGATAGDARSPYAAAL